MKKSIRVRFYVIFAFTAAITASSAPASAAQEPESNPFDEATPGQMSGFKLTKEQESALEDALEENSDMTLDESLNVVDDSGDIPDSLYDNPDQVNESCSSLFLYGEPTGYYHFRQTIHDGIGEPSYGTITIGTNGVGSEPDIRNLTPADGTQQIWNDSVNLGMDPTMHTMEGYMVTTGGYYCSTTWPFGRQLEAVW